MRFFSPLLVALALPALLCAGDPTFVYSPNKAFVVAWFDTDTGNPIGSIRSIILYQLPHGDKPFSLVTFPRFTQAYWSEDSKRCVIIDAPDNGNTNTWIFTAIDSGTQSDAVPIYPLKSLEQHFLDHWDGKRLWRPGISKAVWINNSTLEFDACDNNGEYKITLHTNSLNKPIIESRKNKSR